MNRILLAAFLIALQFSAAAQIKLKGKLFNPQHEPLAFTEVGLYHPDHTPVLHTNTDSAGAYDLNVPAGIYQLVVVASGQELNRTEILLRADTLMPDIIVNDATELNGIAVTSRKTLVEQKTDRLVFHVENAVSVTGGNALDALKATPTVRVQNESISIVGKGEVMIMIDERLQRIPQEDLAALLKSIPANTIKSIEVISTPPAQYDAEGSSGLINIKLKSARKNAWNANLGGSLIRRTYNSGNLQGLFHYNYNKLTIQTSLSMGKEKLHSSSDSRIFYPAETWQKSVKHTSQNEQFSLGLGIDYQLLKGWTSGIKYSGSFTGRKSASNPFTTISDAAAKGPDRYISTDVAARNKPEMNALNWYHTTKLDQSGKQLVLDLDYFNYQKTDRQFFQGNEWDHNREMIQQSFFSATTSNLNRIKNYSAKADLSLPYNWANISFGAKYAYTHTLNDLKVYDHTSGTTVFNTGQSNLFFYKEHNEALYFSANKKLSPKWESQVGLRMEATQTEGLAQNTNQKNQNHYVKFFPTAYLTYIPNEAHSFALNYSRRIRRPDFDYLNPFIVRSSPYFYSEGNPFLRPSFIDNISFSYTQNQQWVSTLYYTRMSDFSQELSIINPATNVTRLSPLNYANTSQIGISTYYHFNKWHWWNSFTGFNLNYQEISSKTQYISSASGYNAYLYSNNDFSLNQSKSVLFGINYAFQPAGRYQFFDISALHMLDISMKLITCKQQLSLTLVAEDLLNGQRPLIAFTSNAIRNKVRNYNDTRGLRLSLSYTFGNNNMKTTQRDQGNTEERIRTNG